MNFALNIDVLIQYFHLKTQVYPQAKAVCSQFEQVADPCNGPNLPKYKNLHSRGPNPSLKCPPGYEQILCNARSPWLGK